ncbi:unnamed protein product [Trifolium pratense]|uniref:Uncharacterized protein n=1 Tax=Trifolium pratense TaxID=57577 RepID=A0ACB0L5J8_TRIPR|nr:unnamed protein product [Trifolium pratense]
MSESLVTKFMEFCKDRTDFCPIIVIVKNGRLTQAVDCLQTTFLGLRSKRSSVPLTSLHRGQLLLSLLLSNDSCKVRKSFNSLRSLSLKRVHAKTLKLLTHRRSNLLQLTAHLQFSQTLLLRQRTVETEKKLHGKFLTLKLARSNMETEKLKNGDHLPLMPPSGQSGG